MECRGGCRCSSLSSFCYWACSRSEASGWCSRCRVRYHRAGCAFRTLQQLIQDISGRVIQVGPFKVDFSHLDLNDLSQQVLGMVQPLLSRAGSLLGTVAGSAANFLGWTLFVLLVSYFTLAESKGIRDQIITVEIPATTRTSNL